MYLSFKPGRMPSPASPSIQPHESFAPMSFAHTATRSGAPGAIPSALSRTLSVSFPRATCAVNSGFTSSGSLHRVCFHSRQNVTTVADVTRAV